MKISINNYVQALLKLQDKGVNATMLGIGPMSENLVTASFELARDYRFPLMFIASRNQVDLDSLGGGYVNGWDQERFSRDIKAIADKTGFKGYYYLCRDHGGPWQRDKERNDHLPEEEAMELARQSYIADMENGFDLLMIDPTKDPFEVGKVIPLDTVLTRTVELIEFCEEYRKEHGIGEIGYEVGTEETNGGLTTTEKYEEFIIRLEKELKARNLPMPTFIVGQTGTLIRKGEQVGTFNFDNAVDLATMARKYNVALKEHNGDYLDDETLLMHILAHVTATNVAPQYGTEETRALIRLSNVEKRLVQNGTVAKASGLYDLLLKKAIATNRWRKWMTEDQADITGDEVLADPALCVEVLDVAGHYTFNDPEIKEETAVLYDNLAKAGIDGRRYVIECIKRPIKQYVDCYNLEGIDLKVEQQLKEI